MKFLHYIILGLFFGILAGFLALALNEQKDEFRYVSFADAVSKAAPSVVNIYTTKIIQQEVQPSIQNTLLEQFFNQRQKRLKTKKELSLGSGVIMEKSGFIVTNYHVIKNAQEILVLLYDGREALAEVVGTDKETDLAVLKVNLGELIAIEMGDIKPLRVGDPALAIGNPYGFGQTVTSGIISAKGRYGLNLNTYENFIQTDAAINVGSSGGALINHKGQLIGINSAIYSQTGGSQGIGLAIPIDIVTKVLTDIIRHGHVVRGWLGLEVTQLTPAIAERLSINKTDGIIITNTYRNGPAQNAGLQPGDIILSINGKKIDSGQEGLLEVANLPPGEKVAVEIIRNNQSSVVELVVGVRPSVNQ